jgi:hypothetical protein
VLEPKPSEVDLKVVADAEKILPQETSSMLVSSPLVRLSASLCILSIIHNFRFCSKSPSDLMKLRAPKVKPAPSDEAVQKRAYNKSSKSPRSPNPQTLSTESATVGSADAHLGHQDESTAAAVVVPEAVVTDVLSLDKILSIVSQMPSRHLNDAEKQMIAHFRKWSPTDELGIVLNALKSVRAELNNK